MAGLAGIRAEDMDQVDALQRAKLDWPHGLPLIRPQVLAPVLIRNGDALEHVPARYGFSTKFSSFNAREDRLTSSPVWKSLFGKKHGIMALSYVVEWVENAGGGKQPFLIQRRDGKLMMAPALVGHHYERKQEHAFAICTRAPNAFFAHFHDRMIGQCTPNLMDSWLSPDQHSPEELLACVAAPEDDELVAVPADPNLQKRKMGDWSPLKAYGKPLTWEDVRKGTTGAQRTLDSA